MRRKKTIFFLFDGLAETQKPTPLMLANKPNIDWFAKNGLVGTLSLIPSGKPVWSHYAFVSLLGYNPFRAKIKRGVLEAIAAGYNLKEGHLAIRCNFATLQNGLVVDRRAGRNSYGLDELTKDINKMVDIKVPFKFIRTSQHRAVLIIEMELSDEIRGNDPLKEGVKPLNISALSRDALHTAKLLRDFLEQAKQILENHKVNEKRVEMGLKPANYLLLRDAGNKIKAFPRFLKRIRVKNACIISERGVAKSVFLLAGFKAIEIPELGYEKAIDRIFEFVEEALVDNELVVAHLKHTDEASHDKKPREKREIIEYFDQKLASYRNFKGKIVITTDHRTSSITGFHEPGDVPFLVYGKGKNKIAVFDEEAASKSKLESISGKQLWKIVY